MRILFTFLAILAFIPRALPQQRALLSSRDALQLYQKTIQLSESNSIAIPELARAGAPVLENARQALKSLEAPASSADSRLTYTLLTNLRAYLTLADSVPKPYPFPQEAARQMGELRDNVDRIDVHFRALLVQKEAQIRNPDRDNLKRYAEADEMLGPPKAGVPRVVFLGDSITDGWRLNEYYPGRDFVNRGISGQITGEMLGRMKADVINLRPRAMMVLAGTNDIFRGVSLTAIGNNLTMIADLARVYDIKPLFASLLPVSAEQGARRPPETIRAVNAWLQSFCRSRNLVYVDYYGVMVDSDGLMKAGLSDDGLHPNAAGYRIMAPIAQSAIDRLFTPVAPPRGKPQKPVK